MNENNIEVKKPTINDQNFANPLDKCGLQVSKSVKNVKLNINFRKDKKENGD